VVPPARSVSITTAKPDAPPPAQPKRRRSFTGETRTSDRARTDTPRKGRRRTFEEELTLPRAQIPAKAAPPAPPTEPHLGCALADVPHTAGFDDLDEDTRVLQNKPGGGHEDLAEQAKDRMHAREPAPRAPRDEPATEPKPAAAAPAMPPADDDEPGPQSQNTRVWTHVPDMGAPETERPGKGAAAAARPAKKLETIPALRVAALATSVPGEVRLIALEGSEDAPSGAALALLVPLTAADGEAVARLFRG